MMKDLFRILVFWLALALLSLFSRPLSGQSVALVLSGGGARGIAHVGVIKALEECHIPIDYIAGTSMGAIIGGLYASGYSLAQIEAFVLSGDFDRWAQGHQEEQFIYYLKMPDPDASWINLKLFYDPALKKIEPRLPNSLITPYQLDFAILEYYSSASAAAGYDFDSLMVPFRCMASDISSKKAVALSKGQLGQAIRASMTYPFYFKPIEIDSVILFDGGLYDNFPVEVAMREFKPDIIIGSKAADNYLGPRRDDIISQVQSMIVNETDFSLPEDKGILIEPKMPVVSLLDFSRKEEFILAGYTAAINQMDKIRQKIQRRMPDELIDMKRADFNRKKPPLVIDSLSIEGLKLSQQSYVEKLILPRKSSLTLPVIKKEYFKLLADNKIKSIFPSLTYLPDRKFYKMCLEVQRSEQFELGFGGNISSNATTTAFLSGQYTLLDKVGLTVAANGYFGRFYSSANLEVRLDVPSRFPIFTAADFTYNHKNFFKNTTYFIEDESPSFLIQNENHLGIAAGIPATNKGKLVAFLYHGWTRDDYYQTNQFSRADTADRTVFDFWAPQVHFELNSMNFKQYPTAGSYLMMSLRLISGHEKTVFGSTSVRTGEEFHQDHQWLQFRLKYDNYFKTVSFFSAGFYADVLLSNQPSFSNYTATILRTPAFEPVPEMKMMFLENYRSTNYAALGLKFRFGLFKQFDMRLESYFYQPYEELSRGPGGETIIKKALSHRSVAENLSFVYHTFLGPISLSFLYLDRANPNFAVTFNIGYIIFNRSALE